MIVSEFLCEYKDSREQFEVFVHKHLKKYKKGESKKMDDSDVDKVEFSTMKEIIAFVKPLMQCYRQFPSKKDEVVGNLRPIFSAEANEVWGLVIEYNKFTASFHSALGKKGRRSLKKILYELDYDHYKDVDFDID